MNSPPAPDFTASAFRMIDVGGKRTTRRTALAVGWIRVAPVAFAGLRDKTLSKGDASALAEIAGVMGAKATATIIPLCHPLPLDQVVVSIRLDEATGRAWVFARAIARGVTGVEMEALSAVNAALLTIWDLCKAIDPAMEIGGVRLLEKTGGKSGRWLTPIDPPEWLAGEAAPAPLAGRRALVIVLSDRAAGGVYEDRSGPVLRDALLALGAEVTAVRVIPDSPEELTLALSPEGLPDLVLTCGGTGLGPRDHTPDTLSRLFDRPAPGFGELLRSDGANFTPSSWLSRSTAGLIGNTLVVALAGSPKAAREGWEALSTVIPHALRMIAGGGH